MRMLFSTRLLRLLCASASLCWLLTAQEAQPAPTVPAGPVQTENARKAKDILQKSLVALGGDFYGKVFDLKQQGRGYGFYRNEPAGVGIGYTRYYQYPDKERYEYFKNAEWVIIHNGDKGYETTFRGSREEDKKDTADYNRRRRYALDQIMREWLADPKTAFFYEGTTLVGPKQVHQISLLSKDNLSVTLYIDTKTFLPIRKTYSWRDLETHEMEEESELYDEYRTVQNIATPFKVTRMKNGEITSQRFLKSVAYNVGVGNTIFLPPDLTPTKTK